MKPEEKRTTTSGSCSSRGQTSTATLTRHLYHEAEISPCIYYNSRINHQSPRICSVRDPRAHPIENEIPDARATQQRLVDPNSDSGVDKPRGHAVGSQLVLVPGGTTEVRVDLQIALLTRSDGCAVGRSDGLVGSEMWTVYQRRTLGARVGAKGFD